MSVSPLEMFVELGSERHGVDRQWLVVVDNDNLEEPARPVRADVKITVALADHPDGIADRVRDVLVGNTVLAGIVRDVHRKQVTLPLVQWQDPRPV